jgi:hypothetical protein
MSTTGDTADSTSRAQVTIPGRCVPASRGIASTGVKENFGTPSPQDPIPTSPHPQETRQPVSWPLVLGLGSLALLSPLVELTGLADAIGQPATVLLLLAVVALIWIGCVGLARVPRPVITLTLAGAVYGALTAVLGVIFGTGREGVGGAAAVVAVLFELGWSTMLGCLGGLIALAVQSLRRRRQ